MNLHPAVLCKLHLPHTVKGCRDLILQQLAQLEILKVIVILLISEIYLFSNRQNLGRQTKIIQQFCMYTAKFGSQLYAFVIYVSVIIILLGIGVQPEKGSPVNPMAHEQTDLCFMTVHSALAPQEPGQGSTHFSL